MGRGNLPFRSRPATVAPWASTAQPPKWPPPASAKQPAPAIRYKTVHRRQNRLPVIEGAGRTRHGRKARPRTDPPPAREMHPCQHGPAGHKLQLSQASGRRDASPVDSLRSRGGHDEAGGSHNAASMAARQVSTRLIYALHDAADGPANAHTAARQPAIRAPALRDPAANPRTRRRRSHRRQVPASCAPRWRRRPSTGCRCPAKTRHT
jgi:hypothetical protein